MLFTHPFTCDSSLLHAYILATFPTICFPVTLSACSSTQALSTAAKYAHQSHLSNALQDHVVLGWRQSVADDGVYANVRHLETDCTVEYKTRWLVISRMRTCVTIRFRLTYPFLLQTHFWRISPFAAVFWSPTYILFSFSLIHHEFALSKCMTSSHYYCYYYHYYMHFWHGNREICVSFAIWLFI